MYKHNIKKLPKNTIQIDVNVPWEDVKKEYDLAFDALHKDFEYQGYRKGKAPREIAEKNISKDEIYKKLINTLLPRIYAEVLQKENLQPIVSPKVDLTKAKENEEWQFRIVIALKPEVALGNYKEQIKKEKTESKKADIWVPGKDKDKPMQNPEEQKQKALNLALKTLLETAKVEIPDLIIDEELNQKLAKLVDDVQKVGLTVDAYLKSRNTTLDQLKETYRKEIADGYKIEFILSQVAEDEGIKVDQTDIDKLFANIKNDKEREEAKANSYFYASILRKQKTLDFLISL